MPIDEEAILGTMQILTAWNPLGDRAGEIEDLDNYRIEAIDILFSIRINLPGKSPVEIVQSVLNSAFDLSLSLGECRKPAEKIADILSMHQ